MSDSILNKALEFLGRSPPISPPVVEGGRETSTTGHE